MRTGYSIRNPIPNVNGKGTPRFTVKHHLLRHTHPSSLRRTVMYALGISQALHLALAGESGNPLTDWFRRRSKDLTVDLGTLFEPLMDRQKDPAGSLLVLAPCGRDGRDNGRKRLTSRRAP